MNAQVSNDLAVNTPIVLCAPLDYSLVGADCKVCDQLTCAHSETSSGARMLRVAAIAS